LESTACGHSNLLTGPNWFSQTPFNGRRLRTNPADSDPETQSASALKDASRYWFLHGHKLPHPCLRVRTQRIYAILSLVTPYLSIGLASSPVTLTTHSNVFGRRAKQDGGTSATATAPRLPAGRRQGLASHLRRLSCPLQARGTPRRLSRTRR